MHFFEVNIEVFDTFQFTLPVHFIGLGGDQTLQFIVEYGDSMKERGKLSFNVWCGFPGSKIRGFLMTAAVKPDGDPIDSIMNYLQKSEEFEEMAQSFFAHFSG